MTTTLTRGDLAAALGLQVTEFEPGVCDSWVQVEDGSTVGYCLPVGLAKTPLEKWRAGRLLTGEVPTDARMSQAGAFLSGEPVFQPG